MYCKMKDCLEQVQRGTDYCDACAQQRFTDTAFASIVPERVNQNQLDVGAPDLERAVKEDGGELALSRMSLPASDAPPPGWVRPDLGSATTDRRDITKEGAETKDTLGGGATRTKSDFRFDLIPVNTDRRTALRYGLGAKKHGENNWKKGDYTFVVSCVNHLRTHLSTMILEGNEFDDNVGAMLWNVHAIGWYELHKPEEFQKAMNYLNTGKAE